MENHLRRYSKLTLVVLVFILSLSLSLSTVSGQEINREGGLKAWLDERGIGHDQFRQRLREVIQVQNRHKGMLMGLSGVVGTATGITPEGEAVVDVFTSRAAIRGIPPSLDGVAVRTKVTGMFVAFSDPQAWFPRPVPTGVSTGHPNITAGTIGARVTDGTDVFALSNNHIYADSNNAYIGDNALQPGPIDGGTNPGDAIGTLQDFEPISFNGSDNTIDAAIVLSSPGQLGNATPLDDGYGMPNSAIFGDDNGDGYFDDKNDLLNLHVQKYGRTTRLTHGQISDINATVDVCYEAFWFWCLKSARFVDQIIITPGTFSDGGDSGSLIVTDDADKKPVGLLFAGSDTYTIANRIDLVLNRFDVTIDSGAPPSLETISVTPASATIGIGETKQFTATGHYSDGSTPNITADVNITWQSLDPGVATIDPEGLATGVGVGTARITATLDEITSNEAALTVTETPPELESITVTPASATIGIGETQQFTAIGHYSDSSTEDLTSYATWESSNTAVAPILDGGLATGEASGTVSITATYDGITSEPSTLDVTVNENIYLHVGDLDGESKGRRFWRAKIYITVHNSDEQPVAEATVVGSFDDCPDGVDCEKFECTTDSNGMCNVVGWQYWADHLTFTVENVTHATLEYNPDLNHDPDGDSNPPGTSIYVPRP